MKTTKKPNIWLIMTDQQRWDTLGCMGNEIIETGYIDGIAAKGAVFRNAYSCTPSCIPARATLLTGMNPWHTGILGMGRGQGRSTENFAHTLPGELAAAGYHTYGIGKMHFRPQRSLNGFHHLLLDEEGRRETQGFMSDYERWFNEHKDGDYGIVDHGLGWNSWMSRPYHAPEHLHPSHWVANESLKFLENRDPNKPFFLMSSFSRPHSPYDPPAFYYDIYKDKDVPEAWIGDWADIHDVPEDGADPSAWQGKRKDEEIRRARAAYYGSIHYIDHQIGRVYDHLIRSGDFDNTFILFVSDHGDMLGDHHLWRKTYAYEGSAHIPMVIKPPKSLGKSVSRTFDQPVTLQDVMPTLLDAAGVPIPDTVDGLSLLPLMTGQTEETREYVHGEHSTCYAEEQENQYLCDGKIKYIWFPRIDKEQLFDLKKDPHELYDLSADPAYLDILEHWRSRLIAELAPRQAGLTSGDKLVSQKDAPPLVSPYYERRVGS